MNKKERRSLYATAIKAFGRFAQMDMLVEESAELIQAVNKYKRDLNILTAANLAEEIADVEIMIEQIKDIVNLDDTIKKYKAEKLKRLSDKLQKLNPIK
jgi:NTP pyrophosphatase (non-canonical NTP hydrolase)